MSVAYTQHIVRKKWEIPDDFTVKVGFVKGESQTVLNRAIWNEFGTRHIPKRPFMRKSFRRHKNAYKMYMRNIVDSLILYPELGQLEIPKLGLLAQSNVQKEIARLRTPPNAPSTIARKKSSNPLIESGEMRQAVTWARV